MNISHKRKNQTNFNSLALMKKMQRTGSIRIGIKKKNKKDQKSGDFTKKIPEEISYKIFSNLSAKKLILSSSVNKNWKRITNDEFLWAKIVSNQCPRKGHLNSSWKQVFLAFSNEKNLKNMKEEVAETLRITDINESFGYFSGKECQTHNHPCIFAKGSPETNNQKFVISSKNFYEEVPISKWEDSFNLFYFLLKKRNYHPQFNDEN
ncbi:f-box only protein [Anaeramoeba ignava]|uniref:F-box only protein n=1 Tax=Anaeramoeba ignava TaxID=1746090 RepID=A0A9Q0R6R6_ANAIG|nr:f-box only protein [Anaeramoeba ignava]